MLESIVSSPSNTPRCCAYALRTAAGCVGQVGRFDRGGGSTCRWICKAAQANARPSKLPLCLALSGGLPAVRLGQPMAPASATSSGKLSGAVAEPGSAKPFPDHGHQNRVCFPIRWKRAQFRARWQALQNRFRPRGG